MKYKQLIKEQRYEIFALLQTGTPKEKIAEIVNVSASTVYREIERNKGTRKYTPIHAQMLADERKERYTRKRTFSAAVERQVKKRLEEDQWSPEQIVGYCKLKAIPMVSHERIYQHIRADKATGGTLWTHLRHRGKHRKRPVGGGKKVVIKNKISIDERPDVINLRKRLGDWEIDTIIGKDGKGAILTLTERLTSFLMMEKLPEGKAALPLAKVVHNLLVAYKKNTHSITADNGTEFAEHEYIAKKLDLDFFFAHPYSSWERGLNENTNGLIRQYIPKGTDFDDYSHDYIKLIQSKINSRPREKLGFKSPTEVFYLSL
ncbi:IS30 family transposase [Candidatus Symbiothrix dinenymphae]|uniref:IS30 family transposase n=2 Tax=Candidatus Symbiothrix dinenymphae TaxID=467085 RepID=UPI0006C4AFD0|nr:IS30 family transposase [Candidatus Symbiothrix dinenymphae]GAP73430.1 integrase core domain protein [Candidatus Symbiothrix dinenymphae]